jgi:hypothetical protein
MPALQTWRSAPRGAGIPAGNGDILVAACDFVHPASAMSQSLTWWVQVTPGQFSVNELTLMVSPCRSPVTVARI